MHGLPPRLLVECPRCGRECVLRPRRRQCGVCNVYDFCVVFAFFMGCALAVRLWGVL